MLPYERQQFEFLLQTGVERFVERSEQRFRGAARALEQWKQDPELLSTWLSGFCDAIFEDFLLNNVDGACFVLRALSKQKVDQEGEQNTPQSVATQERSVEAHLIELAKSLFCRLLFNKTLESLELHSSFQAMEIHDGTQKEFSEGMSQLDA